MIKQLLCAEESRNLQYLAIDRSITSSNKQTFYYEEWCFYLLLSFTQFSTELL